MDPLSHPSASNPSPSNPATSTAKLTNGPVKLSGAVMAHPRRAEAARLLAGRDAQGRVAVVLDPEPEGPPTALRTANPAWSCVAEDATHHLVLQDDVVLAEGFFAHAERVAAAVPHEAVAFYAGWEGRNGAVVRLAALTGAEWAYALQEHVPCLALMLPAQIARGYARFAAEHGAGWPYDVVMQRYLNVCGVPVRVSVPSTVDHTEVPSIAGNSTHGWRRAALYTSEAPAPTTYDCADFPVVPFYQYGEARCAVRYGTEREYIETERYLQRIGLLEHSHTAFAAAGPSSLSEQVARAVWMTGFALGAAVAGLTTEAPDPSVARAVMESLGPGGLCEDFTADELNELVPPVRDLALAALEEGRRAGRKPATDLPAARVAVTGGEGGFGPQLARLLGDVGQPAGHFPHPVTGKDLDGVAHLVHLGSPAADPGRLADVLAAAEEAGVERLVYAGSAAVYRGSGEQTVTEGSLTGPPHDPVALAWWREEEQCRQWGERSGIPVQVLRLAQPVGPHAPTDTTPAQWIHRVWTRKPLHLCPQRQHQVVDYRDMAGAIAAVLAARPQHPVFHVASGAYEEEELAELISVVARRTPWERLSDPGVPQPVMATDLIGTALHWQGSASLFDGMRALAQWLACDTHGTGTGGPRRADGDG
ncbi:NAD-dependent epimerase/dehydratase family protein [Streptomyces sp. ISID311]|nr:NAD-dependent epimerase/dehydratase family protein [Streptomyces sp. ISID311]